LDINHVVLVGRLTRDAELRYTNSGSAMAAISLAINTRRRRDDQWVDEAHFFDAVVWGKTAESLSPYLTKGKQIGLEGELRQNRWEQDGQRRSKVEIFTRNIQLLGSRGGDGMGGGPSPAGPSPSGPPASGPPADRTGPESGPAGAESGPAGDFEDDIPF
jgi:single-strand DNA-binding protein